MYYNCSLRTSVLMMLGVLFFSCRKDDLQESPPVPGPLPGAGINKIPDSVFLYAQQIYYWNQQLPTYEKFDPGKYANDNSKAPLDILKEELFDITRYAVNPATQLSFEYNPFHPAATKYSTIIDTRNPAGTDNITITAASLKTLGRNYGFTLAALDNNDIRLLCVYKDSPAAVMGLKRGDRVRSINGRIATTTEDFYSFVKKAMEDPVIRLTVVDPVSTQEKNITVTSTLQAQNPLIRDTIFNIGNISTGYLVYDRFTAEDNTRTYLEPVFDRFEKQHITELIVDLRYNGGGFQNTCKYLANRIAPAAANGRVMFKEYYNSLMQQGKASILGNQYLLDQTGKPIMIGEKKITLLDIDFSVEKNTTLFEKEGGPGNLKRIFFIVSEETASASELLINILKPYMDVKLIGVSAAGGQVRTYGKPVGFFDINIDRYKIYMSLYHDKNANDEGDFFNGMPADITTIENPVIDFGDLRDPALRSAFAWITPGYPFPAAEQLRTAIGTFSRRMIYRQGAGQPGLIRQVSDLHLR
jgi:carboxyl-terminal processing protease